MNKPRNFDIKLQELESFTSYLNGMVADGSFYRLSFRERFRHIRKVKQLYTQLRGPVSPVSLRRLLPIAALAALVVPIPIGNDAKATPASFLMSCTMDSSLPASSGNLRIQLAGPVEVPNMERATLTVSGPNMATIQREFSGTLDVISILVPEGENRTFQLEAIPDPAEQSFVMRYRGETTVNLQRGQTKEISLEMNPVPIEPSFASPVKDPFGLPSGIAASYTNPTLGDLDGDGDLDLLIGDYYASNGVFRYFENAGSAKSPAFGAESTDPFSLTSPGYPVAPRLADVDSDGDMDILGTEISTADYADSSVTYFENAGSAGLAEFEASQTIDTVSGTIYPAVGDLDGDGDLDVFLGRYQSWGAGGQDFRYYENTGSATSASFGTSTADPYGLDSTVFSNDFAPVVVDLDGDGDLDVLTGNNSGGLDYFENIGSSTSPQFATPNDPSSFGLSTVGYDAVFAVGDLDADGDTDILVGSDYYGPQSIFYFENQAID